MSVEKKILFLHHHDIYIYIYYWRQVEMAIGVQSERQVGTRSIYYWRQVDITIGV